MMSRKKSSGWTMAKALYVLPIAAFAAIAFANCSKTESENTQDFTYDQELFAQLPKEGKVKFSGNNLDGTKCFLIREANGTIRRANQNEINLSVCTADEEIIEVELISTEEEKSNVDSENPVYFIVEEMPEFPGGEEELRNFIAENTKYPEDAKANGQTGKVFVQFIIDKNGDVKDVELARGIDCESCNNEAMRVVKSMPQWKPGKQSGQAVNVSFVVPINFQLD